MLVKLIMSKVWIGKVEKAEQLERFLKMKGIEIEDFSLVEWDDEGDKVKLVIEGAVYITK